MNKKIRTGFYLLGGFLFLLDRVLKYLAINSMSDHILWSQVGWHPWYNTAGAFSYPASNMTITLLAIPLFIILIYLLINAHKNNQLNAWCFGFIFFGALSNLFDRFFYPGVVDYLYIFWGTINIADILIFAGAAGCLIGLKKH